MSKLSQNINIRAWIGRHNGQWKSLRLQGHKSRSHTHTHRVACRAENGQAGLCSPVINKHSVGSLVLRVEEKGYGPHSREPPHHGRVRGGQGSASHHAEMTLLVRNKVIFHLLATRPWLCAEDYAKFIMCFPSF